MNYLWKNDIKLKSFPSLEKDIYTDTLIIGGGMAGILCAYGLSQTGTDYVLLEAGKIGQGITKGTTAVLTAQHDTLYSDMVKRDGTKTAKNYLEANLDAVKSFRELSLKTDCDFEEKPSIMYSVNNAELMKKEAKTVQALGFNAEFTDASPLPFPIAGAVKYPEMAQFHPLKFLRDISEQLNIYENSFVKTLDGTIAYTDKGKVHAKKVIIATHYPFKNNHGMYFMKLFQRRSYVIALKDAPDLGCTVDAQDENGFYLRNYKDLLLIGGGGHRTGKDGGFKSVREFAKRYYPNSTEVFFWANQDCVSLDGRAYIGRYSQNMPEVYVATGFNLWGMTTSMIASKILCDAVLGRENRFADTFSPSRNMMSAQLFLNAGETIIDFLKPTAKRCSHLGCALNKNEAEGTWDCPCHGSRFDKKGKLIDGPAMKDINI